MLVLRWRRRALGPVAAAVGVASIVAMAVTGGGLSRIYYGTDTRVHVIMLGCLLAVVLDGRPARSGARSVAASPPLGSFWSSPAMPLVATVVVVGAMVLVRDDDAGFYPFGLVAFGLVTTSAVAGCALHGRLPLLSSRALVEIGKRSYGIYLWHWPIQIYLTDGRLGLRHALAVPVRIVVVAAVAWVSYALIERPVVRSRARLPRWWPALPVAVALAFVAATVGATSNPFDTVAIGEVRTFQARPGVAPPPGRAGRPIDSVLILGDSIAILDRSGGGRGVLF